MFFMGTCFNIYSLFFIIQSNAFNRICKQQIILRVVFVIYLDPFSVQTYNNKLQEQSHKCLWMRSPHTTQSNNTVSQYEASIFQVPNTSHLDHHHLCLNLPNSKATNFYLHLVTDISIYSNSILPSQHSTKSNFGNINKQLIYIHMLTEA